MSVSSSTFPTLNYVIDFRFMDGKLSILPGHLPSIITAGRPILVHTGAA